MGSSKEETVRENMPMDQGALERPQIRVTIAKPFAMGKTEVTVGQFAAFIKDTRRPMKECRTFVKEPKFVGWVTVLGSSWDKPIFPQASDHPVACVSWEDAEAYVSWLAEKTGKPYRLPSESEWEYAARGGTQTARYWGDGLDEACEYANVADANAYRHQFKCDDGYSHTAPANFGKPNQYGLYGMLGNIGEWVADCGLPDYATQTPKDGSAYVSGDCTDHVGRGGSWWNDTFYIRAARRYATNGPYNIMGFRVAMDVK